MNRRRAAAVCLGAPTVLLCGRAQSAIRARVGLALPLTGVQSAVANDLLIGYQLSWRRATEQGVEIEPVVVDDHSIADKTATAIGGFGRDRAIVAASGIVGTPHARAALPAARVSGLPVVGIRSGASELRDGGPLVYHLRASFEAELAVTLRTLTAIHKRVAIVASKDAFGEGAARFAVAECARLNLPVSGVTFADRNGADIVARTASALASSQGATALLVLMITRPAIEAVRTARAASFLGAICTMSFTAGTELTSAGPSVYRGLGLASAFPIPRSAHDAVSASFAESVRAVGRPDLANSVTAAEGFWYGTAIADAIARAGGAVNREGIVRAIEGQPGVRLGKDLVVFDAQRVGRRYLNLVHFDHTGLLRT